MANRDQHHRGGLPEDAPFGFASDKPSSGRPRGQIRSDPFPRRLTFCRGFRGLLRGARQNMPSAGDARGRQRLQAGGGTPTRTGRPIQARLWRAGNGKAQPSKLRAKRALRRLGRA